MQDLIAKIKNAQFFQAQTVDTYGDMEVSKTNLTAEVDGGRLVIEKQLDNAPGWSENITSLIVFDANGKIVSSYREKRGEDVYMNDFPSDLRSTVKALLGEQHPSLATRQLPLATIVNYLPDFTGSRGLTRYDFDDADGTGTMDVCMYDVDGMVVRMRFKGLRNNQGAVCASPGDVELMHTVEDAIVFEWEADYPC